MPGDPYLIDRNSRSPHMGTSSPISPTRRLQFQKVAELYSPSLVDTLAAGEYPAGAYVFPQHRIPPYRVDFLVVRPGERYPLAVECDGAAFHDCREQMKADYKREQYIAEKGYNFLRFRGVHIRRDPDNVAARIREALGLFEEGVPATVAGEPWAAP